MFARIIDILNKSNDCIFNNCVAFIMTVVCLYLYSLRGFEHLLSIFFIYLVVNKTINGSIGAFLAPTKIYKYVGVFLSAILISGIFSFFYINIRDSLYFVIWFLPLPMFLYLHNQGKVNAGIRYGLIAIIIGGFLLSLYDYFLLGINRPSGLMYNSALWSSCMGFVLPLFVYGAIVVRNIKKRLGYFFVSVIILTNIFLAASRGIIIALLLVGILLLILFLYKKNRRYGMLLALGICVLFLFLLPSILNIVGRSYDGDRIMAWKASVDMFIKHPIIGVGLMQWKKIYAEYYYSSGELLPHAHNLYLGFLSTTGIIGFGGLVYFLYGWIKSVAIEYAKGKSYFLAALSGIIIFLIHGLVDNVVVVSLYHKVFWFFVAVYQWDIFAED